VQDAHIDTGPHGQNSVEVHSISLHALDQADFGGQTLGRADFGGQTLGRADFGGQTLGRADFGGQTI
jgi:uncharacterized protein YjbI with pentapeptide repeats